MGEDPPGRAWENEVRALYVRSSDMEVNELEALLETVMRGQRPDHPDLPLVLALRTETILE